MTKAKDLTGMKFGKLTVIGRAGSDKHGNALWSCKCECGSTKVVSRGNLRSGNTTSCGCLQKEKAKEHTKDLTGQKFGRLTVIKRAGSNKHKKALWLCKCECGNEKVIVGASLKSGATTSCGCLVNEKSSERMKEQMKEKWQNEDFKQMQSEKMKEQWQNEDFKQMQSERMKEQMKEKWQNEDFKKMQSEQMKDKWQDEDFRKMQWEMHYKGGITPISRHLRGSNFQWFEDCKQKANYTCQLTGKHGCKLNTHHLKAFSTIVIEAHQLHNIDIKPQVKDYTQEELKLLEEYVGNWHKDNSNAVVLSEDVHKLFHSLYGQGENTPEQFEEFRERYMTGEFKEILK